MRAYHFACAALYLHSLPGNLCPHTLVEVPRICCCADSKIDDKKKAQKHIFVLLFCCVASIWFVFFCFCLLFLVSFLAIAGGMTNTSGACIPKPNRRWQQHTTQHNCGWRTVHDKFPQAPPPVWNQSNKYNRKIEQQKKYI